MEDSLGDRTWIENERCRLFVENLLTAFDTKLPSRTVAQSASEGTKEQPSEGWCLHSTIHVPANVFKNFFCLIKLLFNSHPYLCGQKF